MGEEKRPAHEGRDLSVKMIAIFAASLAVFGALSHECLTVLFDRYQKRQDRRDVPAPPLREARVEPPPPRLEEDPGRDLAELRRLEEEQLATYGWIDRERGVVRLPIRRAMKLIAERGLPARPVQRTAD